MKDQEDSESDRDCKLGRLIWEEDLRETGLKGLTCEGPKGGGETDTGRREFTTKSSSKTGS